ncbi:MAG: hypothetical protein WBD36_02250 [Bacteroidota bacterium]
MTDKETALAISTLTVVLRGVLQSSSKSSLDILDRAIDSALSRNPFEGLPTSRNNPSRDEISQSAKAFVKSCKQRNFQ